MKTHLLHELRRPTTYLLIALLIIGGVFLWRAVDAAPSSGESRQPVVTDDGEYKTGTLGDAEAEDAVRAAVRAVPVALSYDYRALDDALEAARAVMTESFAATYTRTFDATTRQLAQSKEAVTSALVRGAGVVGEVTSERAKVVAYVDQVLLSSKASAGDDAVKVVQSRVVIDLRQTSSGDWKIDDIRPF
jgi:hypothetical protein